MVRIKKEAFQPSSLSSASSRGSASRLSRCNVIIQVLVGTWVGIYLPGWLTGQTNVFNDVNHSITVAKTYVADAADVVADAALSTSSLLSSYYMTTSSSDDSHLLSDALTCQQVQQKIQNNTWPDPNAGSAMSYFRQVSVEPKFWVAVHSQQYDPETFASVYQQGWYHEKQVAQQIMTILKDQKANPGLVIDVGAGIGFYTLLSASLGHSVLSFDANPLNSIRLCHSLALNNWSDTGRVSLYTNAVGMTSNEWTQVSVPAGRPWQAKTRAVLPAVAGNTTTLSQSFTTSLTLDDYGHRHGWFDINNGNNRESELNIHLLKVDTAGTEPHVLLGAKRLVESGMIKNVILFSKRIGRGYVQDAFRLLLDNGYVTVETDPIVIAIRKRTKQESIKYLEDLTRSLQGKATGVEVWFAREANNILPVTLHRVN